MNCFLTRDGVLKNNRLLKEASEQLVKDKNLINWLLKDVPSEKLDIKTFIIVDIPESGKEGKIFCQFSKTENVLIVKDFESDNKKVSDKFSMHHTSSRHDETEEYFLLACTRFQYLIGDFPTRALQESHDWMIKYQDNIEKQLIIFNEDQRKIMKKLADSDKIKNFIFSGGPGTGKTMMAVKCCNELLERYMRLGITEVHVYVTTIIAWADAPVLQFMSENINTDNRDNVHTGWLDDICRQISIDVPSAYDGAYAYERNIYRIINILAYKLKAKHQNVPVILIVDEIWYQNYGQDNCGRRVEK